MRRLAALVGGALLLLIAVLVANTLRGGPAEEAVEPVPPLALDRLALAERLSRAIQIETITLAEDAPLRFEAFRELHDVLAESFPRLHAVLEREVVAEGSLLYRWAGTDPSAPPILLMGHLDVVPIEPGTEERWTHPPFAGTVDTEFVWGRGTLDDKVSVVGICEAVEHLVAAGFVPKRTVYLAFGHDEEIGGNVGAKSIAALLQSRGVKLEFTIDEGMGIIGRGLLPAIDHEIALIGLAEKGYLTLDVIATAMGGHSSTPPEQTAVGRLARALTRLEADPQPEAVRGPVAHMFDALANESSFWMRLVLRNRWLFDPVLRAALRREPPQAAMLHTTTAPTMLQAGVKDNVLPTEARATVNFRILPGDSVASVTEHARRAIADPGIELRARAANEPSPTSDPTSPSYRTVARTIRQVFPGAGVAPALVLGGTDSKHYREVAEQSFRFVPLRLAPEDLKRVHGTDERISIDGYADVVRFFVQLLQNAAGNGDGVK
ncbi:MAG TPA: M20 family peptidase [Myxococcota bacterium]|nr:M20 family peptidase [Myxococcota bacterium]